MPDQPDQTLRLHPRRDGFVLGDQRYVGFPDLPELSRESRIKIARWAERLAPSELTGYQRLLLDAYAESPARTRAIEELTGYGRNIEDLLDLHEHGLIDHLSDEQLSCLADPGSHPKLRGRRYPLTVGDLAELTKTSDRQIRYWADLGLLPHERIANRRSFYSGALARAFLLAEADQYEKSAVSALVHGGEQATRVACLVASALLAGARDMPREAREEVTSAAQSILKHSRALGEHVKEDVREKRDAAHRQVRKARIDAKTTGRKATASRSTRRTKKVSARTH